MGEDPFLVVNGDVFTDYPFAQLTTQPSKLVHLVLVRNPPQHPKGDFALQDARLLRQGNEMHTFSGIGVYTPSFFKDCKPGKFPLAPMLFEAIENEQATGELYEGLWEDVGTVERLNKLNETG